LFTTDALALADLHAEYRGLADAHEVLFTEHAALRKAHRALEQECRAAHDREAFWRAAAMRELEERLAAPQQTPQGPDLDKILTSLLAVVHPDRWSAGQSVEQLAHELTILVLHVREQLEGQL
jgi:hypothetical protein